MHSRKRHGWIASAFGPNNGPAEIVGKCTVSQRGERWYDFDCVRDIAGLPPEILFIPLPGHTLGHAGIAIQTSERWLLQAGDAYFYHREMDFTEPWCTPGLRFYQTMMEKDRDARLGNQQRLRQLRHAHGGESSFSVHMTRLNTNILLVTRSAHPQAPRVCRTCVSTITFGRGNKAAIEDVETTSAAMP